MLKVKRERSEKHRRWIASLPCCVTLREGETQAAHIRAGCFSLGMKPCDSLCLPLSVDMHTLQHHAGEKIFWANYGGIDRAKKLAKRLWDISGDTTTALYEIRRFFNDR